MQETEIDDRTFAKFARMIYDKCGIVISENKRAMLQARLSKRMRTLGMNEFNQYFRKVQDDQSGDEIISFLDAVSTNVTNFFREKEHFVFLKKMLEEWEAQGQTRFRIWCAAASTGEEPYTIAMVLHATLGYTADARILATDISTKALATAREGCYNSEKTGPIPTDMLRTYFISRNTPAGVRYEANSSLRNLIKFGRLNLATPPYPLRGPLDIIFCRNVMIYFDNPMRIKVINEFARLVRPGGYMIVGHAESLAGSLTDHFYAVQPAVYRKK